MREKESLECGRMHIWALKTKKLPGHLSRPWPQMACFTHATLLCYISNFWSQNLGLLLTKSLIHTWSCAVQPQGHTQTSIPFMRDPYVDRKMGAYQNEPILDGLVPIFTGRNEVVAKVMFLLVSVILLTLGVSASVHAGISPPRSRHPPGADTPPPGADTPPQEQTHPPGADTPPGMRLWHTVNERPVRILLECILVSTTIVVMEWGGNEICDTLRNKSFKVIYGALCYKWQSQVTVVSCKKWTREKWSENMIVTKETEVIETAALSCLSTWKHWYLPHFCIKSLSTVLTIYKYPFQASISNDVVSFC